MSNGEAASPAAKGMAGLVVADSSVGFVDGASGILEYRGYDIGVLAENSTYEEVAYLLWNGRLPTANQAGGHETPVTRVPFYAPGGHRRVAQPAQESDAMAVMRTSVSLLAHYDPESEENTPIGTPAQSLPCACWASLRGWWPCSSASAAAKIR